MKKIHNIVGFLFIALFVILVLGALFAPNNLIFTSLWDIGVLTFNGEGSLLVVFIASLLSLGVGLFLIMSQVNAKKN